MGMPLPSSGDIKTVPLSMPPVPATCGVTGAAVAAGAAGGGGAAFFEAAF